MNRSPARGANALTTLPRGGNPPFTHAVVAMRRPNEQREGEEWLKEVVKTFKQAVQAEDMQAPVENAVLTPNSALLHVGGRKHHRQVARRQTHRPDDPIWRRDHPHHPDGGPNCGSPEAS